MHLDDFKYLHDKLFCATMFYGCLDVVVNNMLMDNAILILQGHKLYVSKEYFYRLTNEAMEMIPISVFKEIINSQDNKLPLFSKRVTAF